MAIGFWGKLPPWVGIARVDEGDAIPDGLSYTILPEVIYFRFLFLRVIGTEIKIGLVPCIATHLRILLRAKVESLMHRDHRPMWGWKKFLQITFKGASA